MERGMLKIVPKDSKQREAYSLDIPDIYHENDPELKAILREQLEAFLDERYS